jgi:hypothetical protein
MVYSTRLIHGGRLCVCPVALKTVFGLRTPAHPSFISGFFHSTGCIKKFQRGAEVGLSGRNIQGLKGDNILLYWQFANLMCDAKKVFF